MGQKHAKYNNSSEGQSNRLLCCSSQNKKDARNSTITASRIRKPRTHVKNMTNTYDELIIQNSQMNKLSKI